MRHLACSSLAEVAYFADEWPVQFWDWPVDDSKKMLLDVYLFYMVFDVLYHSYMIDNHGEGLKGMQHEISKLVIFSTLMNIFTNFNICWQIFRDSSVRSFHFLPLSIDNLSLTLVKF